MDRLKCLIRICNKMMHQIEQDKTQLRRKIKSKIMMDRGNKILKINS